VLMVESRSTRGSPAEAPTAGYLANPINGHEWVPQRDDDLMYACILPLAEPRDCLELLGTPAGCDCRETPADLELNPLCQAPDGSYSNLQRFGKAYPGLRHLEVLRGIGAQAVVGSICARNTADASLPDFGYRPVLNALTQELDAVLVTE
jgi:hypothetical protein